MLNVTLLPILDDNYCYILQSSEAVGIVDPGDATPILKYLADNNLAPTHIFITHHHPDHTDGIEDIVKKFDIPVIGPAEEKSKIPSLTIELSEGDTYSFGDNTFNIIKCSGHTDGHICFHDAQSKILFSGDALFAMGCGRLFEGTPEEAFEGLQKLMPLPPDTKVYCGHEYTQTNGNFCLSVDPNNQDLVTRMEKVKQLRINDQPTIPTTLGIEKKTNIFLKSKTAEEFKKYRALRDNF